MSNYRSPHRRGLRLGRVKPCYVEIVLDQDDGPCAGEMEIGQVFARPAAWVLTSQVPRPSGDFVDEGLRRPERAWEHDRNANHAKANWRFTTPNARIKLKHLYPSI